MVTTIKVSVRYWPDRGLVFECVTCFCVVTLWLPLNSTLNKQAQILNISSFIEKMVNGDADRQGDGCTLKQKCTLA